MENGPDIQPGDDKNAPESTGEAIEENMSSKRPTADKGASREAKKEDWVSRNQSTENKKTIQKSEEESVNSEVASQPAKGNAVLKKTVGAEGTCGTRDEVTERRKKPEVLLFQLSLAERSTYALFTCTFQLPSFHMYFS